MVGRPHSSNEALFRTVDDASPHVREWCDGDVRGADLRGGHNMLLSEGRRRALEMGRIATRRPTHPDIQWIFGVLYFFCS